MSLARRAARAALAASFISGGLDQLRNPQPKAGPASPIAKPIADRVPQLPNDPESLVKIDGAIKVVGGLGLVFGPFARPAALLLAGSLVPTTLAGHRFWETTDPDQKASDRVEFFKNVSLIGGLLIAALDTGGRPSVPYVAGKALKGVGQAVGEAADTVGDTVCGAAGALAGAADRGRRRGGDRGRRGGAGCRGRHLEGQPPVGEEVREGREADRGAARGRGGAGRQGGQELGQGREEGEVERGRVRQGGQGEGCRGLRRRRGPRGRGGGEGEGGLRGLPLSRVRDPVPAPPGGVLGCSGSRRTVAAAVRSAARCAYRAASTVTAATTVAEAASAPTGSTSSGAGGRFGSTSSSPCTSPSATQPARRR